MHRNAVVHNMFSLQQICLALLLVAIAFIARICLKVLRARKLLESWVPAAPRVPILGSAFEFKGQTEILNDVARLLNNPKKSSYVEMAGYWSIISQDYDFTEFLLSSQKILTKSVDYQFLYPWLGNGLLTSAGQKWKQHRRIITPAFHFSILEQFLDIFNANEEVMIKKLKREAIGKDSVNIYKYINICTLDIICETAMGVNIDAQNNENQEYVKAVKDMCRIVTDRTISSWKGIDPLFWFTEDYKTQCKSLKVLHNFTNSVIEKRKKELENKQNEKSPSEADDLGRKRKKAFLDLLLNATIDGQPLSQEDIREEVDTFMFAGHDTTSSAISSAIYVFANQPEAQKMARDELKEIFGKDRDRAPTYQDLQEMKYLELFVKEVLRLYPPATLISRKVDEDVEYNGHTIPKDTILTIFIYGINRDPDYYDEPEVFKPEKFMESAGKKPYSYIPFSAGPRNCIGQKFALLELKSILSKFLMHFEILPTNPPHKLLLASDVVLKSLNGFNIRLKELKWEG